MIYHPQFRRKVKSALVANKVPASVAKRLTEELATTTKYYSQEVAIYSRYFTLYEPTLYFATLCKDLATGTAQFSETISPAILMLGVLHWIQHVDYNYGFSQRPKSWGRSLSQPFPDMDPKMKLSQAAICLALALPTNTSSASTAEEHVHALLDRISQIPNLGNVPIPDVQEIKDTVAQLNSMGVLTTEQGWFVPRTKISFQVPDED